MIYSFLMWRFFLRLFPCLLLAACAGGGSGDYGVSPSPYSSTPQPRYKVGAPYEIEGRWYRPEENYAYREVGVASWYGPGFDGRKTANGDVFDQNELTAAHRTLPMPSLVQVTNLDNGRQIVLRVNDRGPFAKERIIDVSKRAAQLLGFERQGTARVEVAILAEESRALALAAQGMAVAPIPEFSAAPRPPSLPPVKPAFASEALKTPQKPALVREGSVPPRRPQPPLLAAPSPAPEALPGGYYVQAGAYSARANAERMAARLQGMGAVHVAPGGSVQKPLYRVRVGPFSGQRDAENFLLLLAQAGIEGARVVRN